ncbi:MAG: toprim domain-containing protein [Anaerovoracaceae bacterium]
MRDLDDLKREVSIVDYAVRIGFTPRRIGRYFTLKEHDSVRIDPVRNIFIQNSTGRGGSIIDFIMCFEAKTQGQAIHKLQKISDQGLQRSFAAEAVNLSKPPVAKDCKLILPKTDSNMRNIFAYLIKQRHIASVVVEEMVKMGRLYQDVRKNCVFVSPDKKHPLFACMRGTNTYKRFLGDVEGSDYTHLFYIDYGKKSLLITESVIDTMSIMTLMLRAGKDFRKQDYLSLCGCQKYEAAIKKRFNCKQYEQTIICLDGDGAGRKAAKEIGFFLRCLGFKGKIIDLFPKEGKDFNEFLTIKERKNESDGFCRR